MRTDILIIRKAAGMANVDFTLEDIREVVREEFKASFKSEFDAAFKPAFDTAFKESFKPAFVEAFEPHAEAIQQDFNRIHDKLAEHDERFDRLEAEVDILKHDIGEVKTEIKSIKRLVGQHSKEIIEFRARTA